MSKYLLQNVKTEENPLGVDMIEIASNLGNITDLSVSNYQSNCNELQFNRVDKTTCNKKFQTYDINTPKLENTEFLLDAPFQNITFLSKRNGNYEAFANFKIKSIKIKQFDNKLCIEEQVMIEIGMFDNSTASVSIPKIKTTNPKQLVEAFQQQASVSFLSKRKPEIDGKLLVNFLSTKMLDAQYINVRCFNGWALDKKPRLYFKYDTDLPSTLKSFNYELNFDVNLDCKKSLLDFAKMSMVFNKKVLFVILNLWSVYSSLFTIFANLGLKMNKVLSISHHNLPIDELSNYFLQPYDKSSWLNSKTKKKIIKDFILNSKDSVVLFKDNIQKDKRDKEIISSNFDLIIDYYTGNSPLINTIKTGELHTYHANSTVAVISNSFFTEYPDKCIGLELNASNVHVKKFLRLKNRKNILANYLYTIITYVENNYDIISEIIRNTYNKYKDIKSFEYEDNANAFAILMATYKVVNYIYAAYELDVNSIIYNEEIEMYREIGYFIGNNEILRDTVCYADSFLKLLFKAIKSDTFTICNLNDISYSTKLESTKPIVFYDEKYIYISRKDADKHIWSNSNFSHTTINAALIDLKDREYIKTDKDSYEPKVFIEPLIVDGRFDPRVRMLHFNRKKIEDIFDEPIFEEEYYVSDEQVD